MPDTQSLRRWRAGRLALPRVEQRKRSTVLSGSATRPATTAIVLYDGLTKLTRRPNGVQVGHLLIDLNLGRAFVAI
jgi:hypothetical protein